MTSLCRHSSAHKIVNWVTTADGVFTPTTQRNSTVSLRRRCVLGISNSVPPAAGDFDKSSLSPASDCAEEVTAGTGGIPAVDGCWSKAGTATAAAAGGVGSAVSAVISRLSGRAEDGDSGRASSASLRSPVNSATVIITTAI